MKLQLDRCLLVHECIEDAETWMSQDAMCRSGRKMSQYRSCNNDNVIPRNYRPHPMLEGSAVLLWIVHFGITNMSDCHAFL